MPIIIPVDDGKVFLAGSVDLGIGHYTGEGENLPVGAEGLEVLGGRADEHVVHKEALPGEFGIHPHFESVVGIGAGVRVAYEDLVQRDDVIHYAILQDLRVAGFDRDVDVAPIDFVFGEGIFDDKTILGRATRKLTGVDHQCSRATQFTELILDGSFYQGGRLKVD